MPKTFKDLSKTRLREIELVRHPESPEGRAAMERLFIKYEPALIAFAEYELRNHRCCQDAEDIVSSFFTERMLKAPKIEQAENEPAEQKERTKKRKHMLDAFKQGKGHFRPYLKTCFKNFLIDQLRMSPPGMRDDSSPDKKPTNGRARKATASKARTIRLDDALPINNLTPSVAFDLEWRRILCREALEATLNDIRNDKEMAEDAEIVFRWIFLQDESARDACKQIKKRGRRHRLKKLLAKKLQDEILIRIIDTVDDPATCDEEVNHLFSLGVASALR